MKTVSLWIIIILLIPPPIFAQTNASSFTVKGTVIDSVSKRPLDFITVALKKNKQTVKTVLTKSDGAFTFEKVSPADYSLVVVAVGYSAKTLDVKVTSQSSQVTDLGQILISSQSKELNQVVVTADKPLIKQEVDRIAYDVQADPESKVQTVLDMLRKVPLVTIDADDNIQVKGSSSFKVLINGRPSSLVAHSPKDVFKSMPASNIQKIEVITTPPAKYDSEGLAGILNIITNKKVDNGYNGGVGVRYGYPYGPGGNLNFTLKQGKFGFQGYGGTSLQRSPSTTFGVSRFGLGAAPTNLEQAGENKYRGAFNYGDAELSYEIDSLNLITGSVGLNGGNFDMNRDQFSALYDENGDVNQSYILNNDGNNNWHGYDLGVNYQLGFKRNKEQLLTGSYKYTNSAEDQDNNLLNSQRVNYSELSFPDLQQANTSGSKEQTFQLDYVHPLKKINIEGGLKGILRNNYSDYQQLTRDPQSGEFMVNEQQTNQFNYQQNVYGFYNSYQLKLKNWGVKAGLRLERTVVDADFKSTSTTVKQNYNNFIPSVSVQRKFKNMSSLNLGYTQRIQRPGIWQLNPFIDKSNPQAINSGNPNLEAVLNNSFDLSYSKFKKGSVNVGLSYSFANNTVENVVTLGSDNITSTNWQNIGRNRNLGTNINLSYPFTKKLSVNVNGRMSYLWIQGTYNGELYKNDGIQGNIYAYAGYRFEKGWRAGLNAGYYSPWVRLQGLSSSSYYTSFSINKEFLKQKATVSLSTSNPFSKMRRYENEVNTPDFTQSTYSNYYFRNMNISFNYRFGKLKEGIKKTRKGISNDDVKSGGNSTGAGTGQ